MAGEIPSLKGLGTAKTHSGEGKKSSLSPRLLSLLSLPFVAISCSPKPTPDIPQITTPTTILTEGVPTPIATESPTYKQLDAIRQKVVDLASQINGISILDSANSDQFLVDQKTILQQFQDSQQADIDNFLTQNTLGAKITLASTQVISAMTDQGGSFEAGFSTLQYSNISDGKPLGSALTFQFKDFQGNVVNAALLQDTDQTIDGKTVRRFMALSGQTGGVIFPAIIAVYDNSTDASPAQVYVLIPDGNGNFKVMPLKGDADSQNIQAFSGQTENISFKITRPTPTVIETPSVPMIEVGGLQIPDPKASNPELFNLTSPDSPIVQFANAFGVNPEEVGNLTPQLLTGIDGKQFVVMTTGDLAATSNFDESGTPLLIAEQGENGEWEWKITDLGNLADAKGKIIRLAYNVLMLNSGNSQYDQVALLFNGFTSPDGLWYIPYSPQDSLRPDMNTFNFGVFDRNFKFLADRGDNNIMFFHLIWGYQQVLPSWLLNDNFTSDQFKIIATDHIKGVMTHFKDQVEKYVVVNEAWGNPWEDTSKFWFNKLGDPSLWVNEMFQVAHDTDPNAKLVFNDFGIEIPGTRLWNGPKDQQFFNIAKEMQQAGLPIEVGFQLHLYSADFNNSTTFNQLIENYRLQLRKYITAGLPVNITEFDLNPEGIDPQNIQSLNAKITEALLIVSLEEGVQDFTFFGLAPSYAPNAVLFKQLDQPTQAFYTSERALLNFSK